MCLAIPGKILAVAQREGSRMGRVEFGGIVRMVCLDLVPDARPGDYVMVHVGYAISRVDADEAERAFEMLRALEASEVAAGKP